jgi:hypothetical protein
VVRSQNVSTPNDFHAALKDEDDAHPVASAWRPPLREIVKALARGDYALAEPIRSVAPVSANTADQMKSYVAEYGETLCELPDEAWSTSVSQWTGTRWEVLVDLWTVESGPSDMVLHTFVSEAKDGFLIEIHLVYVP